jgi:nicotinate-nucleotide adenylyltransferase
VPAVSAIGVLGGAFNPPHIGHLVLAQEAAGQLGLERVLLVPTGRAPHKPIADDPGAGLRLEMTTLAVEGNDTLRVDPVEVEGAADTDRPSYTADTLEVMSRELGGHELVLLMGADVARRFATWHEPQRILGLAKLAIAGRPGATVEQAEAAVAGLQGSVMRVEMPEIGISSSEIRRRAAAGASIRYLVPEAVRDLIAERELYRG